MGGGGWSKAGEQSFKFEATTVFLYRDESRDGRKTRTSCDKGSPSNWNGDTDQLADHLKLAFFFLNPHLQGAHGRHRAYKHGPCTISSVLARARAKIANIDPFLLSALDTITLMP